MPKYLIEASYTAEGVRGLQREAGSGRQAAIKRAVETLGGELNCLYFALGECDVITIADLPDTASAVAFALAVSSAGFARTKTTRLLTPDEADRALEKWVSYHPPGV